MQHATVVVTRLSWNEGMRDIMLCQTASVFDVCFLRVLAV